MALRGTTKAGTLAARAVLSLLSLSCLPSHAAEPDANQLASQALFDWAEYRLPDVFSPPQPETRQKNGYLTRYYSDTGNYLGVKGGDVFGFGPFFSNLGEPGNGVKKVAALGHFLSRMHNDGFGPYSGEKLLLTEVVAQPFTGSDHWFELYSAGSEPVQLSTYQVRNASDAGVALSLPEASLAPGDYLVVHTSNNSTSLHPYQVIMTLEKTDSIRLFKSGKLVDSLAWKESEALQGYSIGRYPGPRSTSRTLLPSAGSRNALAMRGPLVVNEVSASATTGEDWFELYNNGTEPLALADYFAIDDSDAAPSPLPDVMLAPNAFLKIIAPGNGASPTTGSVNFKLGSSDSVRLIKTGAIVDYLQWSKGQAPADYTFGSLTDGSFNTSPMLPTPGSSNGNVLQVAPKTALPLFMPNTVAEVHFTLSDNDWQWIKDNPAAEECVQGDLSVNGVVVRNVGIRTKGYSTLGSAIRAGVHRFPFKVDMNRYVEDQTFFGYKKLSFNNNAFDPTYMREVLSYELFKAMGVKTPKTMYANLYVNQQLIGLYTVVEQIDSFFIDQHFANDDGDLYQPAGKAGALDYHGETITDYPGLGLETNEDTSDHSAIFNLVKALQNPQSELASVLDVDAALRYLAVSTAMVNIDSYLGEHAQNYFLYEEEGMFTILPWDLNMSFAGFSRNCTQGQVENYLIDEVSSIPVSERPLIERLMQDPVNRARYREYLAELIEGPFSVEALQDRINGLDQLISRHVQHDPSAFFTFDQYRYSLGYNRTPMQQNQPGGLINVNIYSLMGLVEDRVTAIATQLANPDLASSQGRGACFK